ncbi:RNA-binding protein BRN1-like isoform X2 [Nymphaea colorata]|uniref:RNA-binding protein BRN1-like isoform X2 n=1 Tax=Nymphaea colorata TaxID=210225 RepID=UPI00129D560E|nr:RNA-binding protein BRN1-like isoform X2 [Nymphaea colorata]
MGDGGGGSDANAGESVKLFVGQVPKSMTEAQLLAMFREVALVDEVNIIKDKLSKASRGCCFVICPSRQEADKAISACHNKRTLPGAASPLQVKYADGELERLEHKLFVGMLPKTVSEAEVSDLFSKYGNIRDLQILRGSQQTSKGCAFLKYETKDQAISAIEALNGKHRMEGSTVPLVVKWADTEKERQARRAQKAQSQSPNMQVSDSAHQASIFGAMPMGFIPPYNGYSYQAPGAFGLLQYPLPAMQNQPGFHNIVPAVNQGAALRGLQYPIAYPGGVIGHTPLTSAPGSVSPAPVNNSSSPNIKTSSTQVEGIRSGTEH